MTKDMLGLRHMKSIKDRCKEAFDSLDNDELLGSRVTVYALGNVIEGFGVAFITTKDSEVIGPAFSLYQTDGSVVIIPMRNVDLIKYHDDKGE